MIAGALDEARGATMVVLGDSLAQGRNDPDPSGGWIGWGRRLAGRLGIPAGRIANVAAEGATAASIASGQLAAVRGTRPKIVLVSCGMNDVLTGFDRHESAAALDEVLGWARRAEAMTVVSTLPVPPVIGQPIISQLRKRRVLERLRLFNEELLRSAQRHAIRCADEGVLPGITAPHLWSADGVHLSAAGHVYVTNEIEKFLVGELGFAAGA